MKRFVKTFCIAAFTALGLAAAAQTAQMATGFNVQGLIMQLSLYLPEDLAQGTLGFRGPPGAQPSAQPGGGQQRFQLQYTRDPKNYLTKDQTSKLIPILQGLRENPLPSPTKARKIQTDVDAVLTAVQKAEYAKFQKALEKARQDAQGNQTAGGAGGTGGGQVPDFRNMTDAQRQQYLNSLPADQRQRLQQRMAQGGSGAGGANGGQPLTETERRQRQVDEFIAVLQNWLKQAK